MTGQITLEPFDTSLEQVVQDMTGLWNASLGPELAITPQLLTYNLLPSMGFIKEGQIAVVDGKKVGFVLATTWMQNPPVGFPVPQTRVGWIDPLIVHPAYQKSGVGSRLLTWAEDWLRSQGCSSVHLGASLRTCLAGYPFELPRLDFFLKRGFVEAATVWDVGRDLGDGKPITRRPQPAGGIIKPAGAEDTPALYEFLNREFPGGWLQMYDDFVKAGGSNADVVILLLNGRIEGFAWVTFEQSRRPIDRYFLHKLPSPWGQLGPIGISASLRGLGWGGAVLQAGLEYLHSQGVRGCVIDWTDKVGFYGKYGFEKYRQYHMLVKNLSVG